MKHNFPKTPFATRLSGDAKETELRLRNIFQWKKKRPPVWLLVLLCAVVLGCGWLVGFQSQSKDTSAPIEAYQAVLSGEATFRTVESEPRELTMDQLSKAISPDFAEVVTAERLTVLDLDCDGTPEVVLRLATKEENEFAYLVLRYHEGTVNSYLLLPALMSGLKTDRTFVFSNAADSHGVATLVFKPDHCTYDYLAHSYPNESETQTIIEYRVNGQAVSQAEFDAVYQAQEGKTDVTWYAFNPHTIQDLESLYVEEPSDYADFFAHYRSDFPPLEESPVLPSPTGRSFVLQDAPENLAEQIIQDHYYYELTFEFDKSLALTGDEALRLAIQNEAETVANSTGSGAELNGSWVTAPLEVTVLGGNGPETVSSFHRLSIGRDRTGTWSSYFGSDFPESRRAFTYQVEGNTLRLEFQDGGTEEYTVSLAHDFLELDGRVDMQFYREPGMHFSELILHSLDTFTRENFFPGGGYFEEQEWSDRFLEDLMEEVAEHSLVEYTVVCANLSWKWTDAALDAGPQLGNGRYERPFLLGRTEEDENWKIYELYWGDLTFNRSLEPYNSPLAEELAQLGLDCYEDYNYTPKLTTLLYHTIDSRSLMLVESEGYPHMIGLDNLVMGVWDEKTGEFVGQTYALGGDEAGYSSWKGEDGCLYVLWTNTTYYQGIGTSHGIDFFRFDGQTLEPIYELPDCALTCGVLPEGAEDILGPDEDFWYDRKAWPIAGGIYFYEADPSWNPSRPGEGSQYLYKGFVPFTDSARERAGEGESGSACTGGLNLDGTGGGDDSISLLTIQQPEQWNGRLFLEATLGSGQTLTWEAETADSYYWIDGLHAAYLTSTEKQTIILELWPFGANWTPALYILLEVEDGALVERGRMTISHDGPDPGSLIPDTPLTGLEVSDPDSSGLQALRIPTHVDKWSSPDWRTLRWNGTGWHYE